LNKHNIQEDKRTLFGLNYLLNTPKSKVGFLTTFYPCWNCWFGQCGDVYLDANPLC